MTINKMLLLGAIESHCILYYQKLRNTGLRKTNVCLLVDNHNFYEKFHTNSLY